MSNHIHQMAEDFYPYAKKQLGFTEDVKIQFLEDDENANNPLGKTAYYSPTEKQIVVYISGRHPKDIIRSLAHELVHHNQNCGGQFSEAFDNADPGYAQNDKHLREMEREAYETGNLMFRDWEDSIKANHSHLGSPVDITEHLSKRNYLLNESLMKHWGYNNKQGE